MLLAYSFGLGGHLYSQMPSLKEYKWPLKSHPQFVNRWYLASNSSHLRYIMVDSSFKDNLESPEFLTYTTSFFFLEKNRKSD